MPGTRNRFLVSGFGLLAFAVGACGDSTGGSGSPQAQLLLRPQFPATYTAGTFDMAVDRVRVRVIRPPAVTVVDTVVLFPANTSELTIRVKVPLLGRREVLIAGLELSAGTRVLFWGTREVEVTDVPNTPTIPLRYVGPGADMTSLRIEPRDSALRPGEAFTYRVLAFREQTSLPSFYVGWSTNDPDLVDVDARGSLVAPGERGSFMLHVVSPTGIMDSTRVWISLPPTTVSYVSGDEQIGEAGTRLPEPLVVRVLALDGEGVPGVPVRFTALSGGSVTEPNVTTDANGFARTTVTLGRIAGPQVFEASVPSLPTITFRANAQAGPPFRVSTLAGGNQHGTVGQLLDGALIARVTDAVGNLLAGVPVTWEVVTGGGVLEQVDTQTNLSGLVFGIYRLGTLPGTNAIRVTVTGTSLFANFTATANAGQPALMAVVSGDGQSGLPGATLAPFTVRVTDEIGNPLPGVTVLWTDSNAGGTFGNAETTTDINGRATAAYRLPSLPGPVPIRADVPGTSVSTTFTATAAEPPTRSSMRSPQPGPRPASSGGSRRAG